VPTSSQISSRKIQSFYSPRRLSHSLSHSTSSKSRHEALVEYCASVLQQRHNEKTIMMLMRLEPPPKCTRFFFPRKKKPQNSHETKHSKRAFTSLSLSLQRVNTLQACSLSPEHLQKRQSYTYNTRTALPPSPPPTTTTTTSATTTTGFHKLSLHLSNYRVNAAVRVKIPASPAIVFSSLPQEGRNPAS